LENKQPAAAKRDQHIHSVDKIFYDIFQPLPGLLFLLM